MSKNRPLTTTVIGSYPKPAWLSEGGTAVNRWDVDRSWRFQGEELRRKQDEATEWALKEQDEAGIDIVTDGEERRDNYIYYHCRHLEGFDFEHRAVKTVRAGNYEMVVPTITGPVASLQPFLPADYLFARDHTHRRVKMVIPGPMTIIDSTKDEHYGDEAALAMDLAAAIRVEVEALAAAGCDVIQFDEPAFLRYPDKFLDHGLRALEACFEGIEGILTSVHICCGYPSDPENLRKADPDDYRLLGPALAGSKIDQVSLEAAHQPFDLSVLSSFGDKDIIYGLVDIGDPRVESVDEIEGRIRELLHHLPPERLVSSPDCGLILLTPEVAKAKLTNLVQATQRVRQGL